MKKLGSTTNAKGIPKPENPENDDVGEYQKRVVVKTETLDTLEKQLGWMHENVVDSLHDLLDVVPSNEYLGNFCGSRIDWLQTEREWLERDLITLKKAKENHVVHVCGMQLENGELAGQGEVLQTTTIPLNDVRKELPLWKEAMLKEYHSLVHETKAIEPVELSMLDQENVEFVPGKLVTVRKTGPNGGKKKCRAVVCGNMLSSDLDPAPGSLYASGADGILIRATLAHSVEMDWGIGLADVRTAFLLAPRPQPVETREVIVVPPKIMVEAQVCKPTERWRVHNALYGFGTSPAHWAVHRDNTMSGFKWDLGEKHLYLQKTPEGNLWKIMQQGSNGCVDVCVGHVLVYVDDIMALAKDDVRQSFFDRLQKEWKCSDVETVDQNNWVRFCGFELKRYGDGVSLMVGQKSYTAELLKRHDGVTPKTCPMLKSEHEEPLEENLTTEDIRAAQAITGELLWLAGRSRPDLSYVVGAMGRQVSKRPKWVQKVGDHVLGFLSTTQDTCLVYRPCSKDHGALGTLQVPRHGRLLEAFADISFAPNGDRSHQGIIICAAGSPIQWEASRQAFHTMSTAEAELVGYCEAATVLKSVEALMKVIHMSCPSGGLVDGSHVDNSFEKVVYGDNSSALSILMNPDGGWRTRHLRLRSSCLRELLRDDPQNWKVRHQRGIDLPADMLTKPIVLQREWIKFWHLLGFHVDPEIPKYGEDSPKTKTKNKPAVPSPASGLESTKEKTEETDDDLTVKKVKALVCIAALSTAAMAKCYAADLRLKCANLVLELAKWLAAVWHSPPSNEGSPKEACSIGWEVEEQSRAIGQKKVQKARGYEPAATNLPRENEPGRSTLQNETSKCVEAPRENEPGDNNLGEFWEPSNEVCWDHREYHTPQEFWDCNPEDEVGDCVAWHSCGQAQHVLESVGCDSPVGKHDVSSRPLLAVKDHCPTGCPSRSLVKLAAMAPKMSKPKPPVPPQVLGPPAAAAAAPPAAVGPKRKAPPLMLLCASAMSDAASSAGRPKQDPYIGTLPKFPPARREAEKAQKKSGGTGLDEMPRHGPWLDEKYRQPNTTGKKDSWSVAKCGNEIFLVKVHRAPRKQRFHPLHRSAPVEAKFLTGERVTKAFFLNPADDGPGFLVSDRWDNPVVRSEAKWTGYTFLTMRNEALEGLKIQLEPADTADGPPWPAAPPAKEDDMDVHVGLHSEMLTPRRQRPQREPGLVIGRLYLDGCLASSGTGTLSSAESQETRLVPMHDPTSPYNKTSGTTSVGYNRGGGGIIRRGVAALEPASSSSGYDPRLQGPTYL